MIKRLLHWLGSLRIAVPLLVSIAVVLAYGTIYEARFGTASVQRFVYRSWWFQALLAFLAVNLALAALERYPWKRTHLPFVLAHLGIILILLGGIIGGRFGIDGQLIIPEGQAERMLQLSQNVLVVHLPNPGITQVFPTHFETTAWVHEPHAQFRIPHEGGPIDLVVDRYYPDAVTEDEVVEGEADDPPAVQVMLRHGDAGGPPMMEEQDQAWLVADDPDRFGMRWGEAHVLLLRPHTAGDWAGLLGVPSTGSIGDRAGTAHAGEGVSQPGGAATRGVLSLELPDLNVRQDIPVPEDFNRPVPVEGTPYTVTFKQYFTDLSITLDGIVNRSDKPNNPAVAFTLSGPEGVEPFLVFALHPEFEAVHARARVIRAHAAYARGAGPALPPNAIGILQDASGAWSCLMTGSQGERYFAACGPGQWYRHPWLEYEFQLAAAYPHARVDTRVSNRGDEIKAETLHVTAQSGTHTAEGWLGLHGALELPLGGAAPVRIEYQPAQHELPVTVKLLDFRKIDYPGIQMAAGFESDVEVTDQKRGLILMRKISMNNPLRYRGFSFYQSSYVEGPTQTTILSVRNDPGTPLVYAGFIIVMLGVAGMFLMRKAGTVVALALWLLLQPHASAAELSTKTLDTFRRIAVQHNGREKPLDSFAWESLKQITGSPQLDHQDPVATVCAIMADPEAWRAKPLIAVPFKPLRQQLGMDLATPRISYNELVATRKLMRMLPVIVQKQQREEKLTMLEQETMDAFDRFAAASALFEQKLDVVPPQPGQQTQEWSTAFDAGPEVQQAWTSWWAVVRGVGSSEEAARRLAQILRARNPAAYPAAWRLELEVQYNHVAPFRLARLLYLVACLLLLLGVSRPQPRMGSAGLALMVAAAAVHALGIATRVILGGRPPVSNFYETMLWLPFVAVALALAFERFWRVRYFALAASALAALMLLLADHVPLDSSITPVVAVLRSNLWLTIHVLTIVASYGALALATILAHLYAWTYLTGRKGKEQALSTLGDALYRVIQVGVVLLAGGIMLGAVWANASWGRYWGWDPKETWALITLLWFVAALHGRLAGWLHGIGLAAAVIGGFLLLLMTYYGVSFYLVGLHSYAGGHAKPLPSLLIGYLIAETAFLLALALVSRRRSHAA